MANMSDFMAPNANTLDALSTSTASSFNQGAQQMSKTASDTTNTAIGLATMQDQVKQKQMQTEKMADQLDQMKFDKLTTGINSITRADPKYRQAIADQVYKGFDRNGIAVDPVWRDALVKDDSTLNQMRQALPILMDRKSDPQARAGAFQALAQYMSPTGADGHDTLSHLIESENKNQVTEADTKVKADANVESAKVRAAAMGAGGSPAGVADDGTPIPPMTLKEKRLAETVHKNALADINDKDLNVMRTAYTNLDNAVRIFKEGGATANEFQELQQAVRANLGIKGTSGVDERSETRIKGLGINMTALHQFLSDDPKSIMDHDSAFANQVLNLASIEQDNKRKQAQSILEQKAATHESSFYDEPAHAKYKKDFQKSLAVRYHQFGLKAPGEQTTAPGGATPPPAGGNAPQIDAVKVQAAIKLGHSVEEIAQHLGVQPADVQKALGSK